jgi:hypothetical protein
MNRHRIANRQGNKYMPATPGLHNDFQQRIHKVTLISHTSYTHLMEPEDVLSNHTPTDTNAKDIFYSISHTPVLICATAGQRCQDRSFPSFVRITEGGLC